MTDHPPECECWHCHHGVRPPETAGLTIDAARRDVTARRYRKRQLAEELARAWHRLDVRDDAYRRLLAYNARLESSRRFAEAVEADLDQLGEAITTGTELANLVHRLEVRRNEYLLDGEAGR